MGMKKQMMQYKENIRRYKESTLCSCEENGWKRNKY